MPPEHGLFRRLAADLLAALGLFTRLPLEWLARLAGPMASHVDLRRSIWFWPLVGAGIGVFAAGLATAGLHANLPPFIAALCAGIAQLWLTGALHEDGLADMADGLGGRTVERRLDIMRDSRIGSYGALALLCGVMLRVACIAVLVPDGRPEGVVLAGMLSRTALLFPLATMKAARQDGLAAALLPLPRWQAMTALILALSIGWWLVGIERLIVALIAALAGCLVIRRVSIRAFGGFTGDVLGAVAVVSELAVLLVMVALRF